MSKDEVLKRLCQLATKVRDTKFDDQSSACFCGQTLGIVVSSEHYQFSETVMEFIEKAVEDAL
jgi:hypothetical protein